ncbi:hypothetical protein HAX54_023177, partial [Datura stramonium]|nr:hypothetical protein [Datura stramonium]
QITLARLDSTNARVIHLERGSIQIEVILLRADLEETEAIVIELKARGPLVEDIEIELLVGDVMLPLASLLGSPPRALPARVPYQELHLPGFHLP